VSLPLFHADLPFNESFSLPQTQNTLLLKKKYLLTFKGKVGLNNIEVKNNYLWGKSFIILPRKKRYGT